MITEPVTEVKSEPEKYNRQFTEFEIWTKNLAETKYAKLPLQDKINVIAQTFGAKTGTITTRPCTGKWRGTSDVSIVFDNNVHLFIGNKRTPNTKKIGVQNELVNQILEQYAPEVVAEVKVRATETLLKREAEDNRAAAEHGLKPYRFLNVELHNGIPDNNRGGYVGWYFVTLEIDGKIHAHSDTSTCYDIKKGNFRDYTHRDFYVAGALKEENCDYVFKNVAFSTKSGSYTMTISDEVLDRAEKRLSERLEAENAISKSNPKQTLENRLYGKFAAMFPEVKNGEYVSQHFESNGPGAAPAFEPLSVEHIGGNRIAMMHTYELNGDLCYDPDMVFEIDNDLRTLTAVSFQQSIPPIYQEVTEENGDGISVDGNGNERIYRGLQRELNVFLGDWLNNINEQQFMPTRATAEIDGADVQIVFDKSGEPHKQEVGLIVHPNGMATPYYAGDSMVHDFKCFVSEGIDVKYRKVTDESLEHRLFEVLREHNEPQPIDNDRGLIANIQGYIQSVGKVYDISEDEICRTLVELREQERGGNYRDVAEFILNEYHAQDMKDIGDMQEIQLPDSTITIAQRNEYGYTADELLPLNRETAISLYDQDHTIYLLYPDNTEAMSFDRQELEIFDGIFGIEKDEWLGILDYQEMMKQNEQMHKEVNLLTGDESKFGIYQVSDKARDVRFLSQAELTKDGGKVDIKNYDLVHTGNLDIRDTQTNLDKIYQDFNSDDRPSDYTGRSVSVSDVIVLQWRGEVSSHYVDSTGFNKLEQFTGHETPDKQSEIAIAEPTIEKTQESMSKKSPSILDRLSEHNKNISHGGNERKSNEMEVG